MPNFLPNRLVVPSIEPTGNFDFKYYYCYCYCYYYYYFIIIDDNAKCSCLRDWGLNLDKVCFGHRTFIIVETLGLCRN